MANKVAFKCKNCGHFETAGQAGEREYPAACTTCGHGVRFDPITGVKQYDDADNWIVLHGLSADDLADHGLTSKDVEKHKPFAPEGEQRPPQSIDRSVEDSLDQEDKTA